MTGYAATAAGFLDAAAADTKAADLPLRQLAALQGIGYALLAVADQLADGNDVAVIANSELGEIAGAVSDLYRDTMGDRVRVALARLRCMGRRSR